MELKELHELSIALASYHRSRVPETRLVSFEDGVDRLVTLKRAEWEGFDWLIEEHGFSPTFLLDEAFDVVRCHPENYDTPLEQSLRSALRGLISVFVSSRHGDNYGLANNNDEVWGRAGAPKLPQSR